MESFMKAIALTKSLQYMVVTSFTLNLIFAGCGSCGPPSNIQVPEKSSAFITSVPKSGKIEGFVISSCGICNFEYKKKRGCSLTIKIGDKVYPVEGSAIHEHGDPHSTEGFCNAVRVAYVSGNVKKNKFYSNSFTLINSPK